MRTANPALNDKAFRRARRFADDAARMTIEGTVTKTGLLLALLVTAATYSYVSLPRPSLFLWACLVVAPLGALVLAIVTIWWKPHWSPVTAPIYAVFEGLVVGAVSAAFERQWPGIVAPAVGLTVGILLALLVVYRAGLIPVTENFALGVVAATSGIVLVYVVTLVLDLFGVTVPYIHDAGPWGILFSLFVVVIAALNLVLDFDFIEGGALAGAPKYMEWYGGLGLMITLVWLYLETLRLLAKLRR